jgi:short-subunit dehydrogenase
MSRVIAILGAGAGLGMSVARRFGREGFRVALVARRKDRLDTMVDELAGEGIEAAAFCSDLAEPGHIPALVAAIRRRFGRIDVVEYGPVSDALGFTPATQLTAATLEGMIPLLLLTPVEVVGALLPEWMDRGDGAFLLSQGASAVEPVPYLSGVGPVMAATRNYLYSLNGELAGTGIYAGTLAVAALITDSEMGEASASAAGGPGSLGAIPTVESDELAELYWDMYTKRDCVEQVHPPSWPYGQ